MTTATKQAQRTPGPWTCLDQFAGGPSITAQGFGHVAQVRIRAYGSKSSPKPRPREAAIADAHFIVKACNAYDDLIYNLSEAAAVLDREGYRIAAARARAAIAKAES